MSCRSPVAYLSDPRLYFDRWCHGQSVTTATFPEDASGFTPGRDNRLYLSIGCSEDRVKPWVSDRPGARGHHHFGPGFLVSTAYAKRGNGVIFPADDPRPSPPFHPDREVKSGYGSKAGRVEAEPAD